MAQLLLYLLSKTYNLEYKTERAVKDCEMASYDLQFRSKTLQMTGPRGTKGRFPS